MQHFKNEVWDTVLHNDPGTLPESVIEAIEDRVLADAVELISRLNDDCLRDKKYMNIMIGDANSDTRNQLRKAAARQAWEKQRRTRV
jgi:hypothetical protein